MMLSSTPCVSAMDWRPWVLLVHGQWFLESIALGAGSFFFSLVIFFLIFICFWLCWVFIVQALLRLQWVGALSSCGAVASLVAAMGSCAQQLCCMSLAMVCGLLQTRNWTCVSALAGRFFTAEPQGILPSLKSGLLRVRSDSCFDSKFWSSLLR